MKRADLKEMIDSYSPPRIPAELYADPLLRSMNRIRQRAWRRYQDELLALYAMRTLTDEQRYDGYRKAINRQDAALKKLEPLRERYDREVWIPLLKETGVLRSLPVKPGKRRA